MNGRILAAIFFATGMYAAQANAIVSPIGVGLVPPLEFPPASGTVEGLRFTLFRGMHESVYGIDFNCMFGDTTKNFAGTQFSLLLNNNSGSTTVIGLQFSVVGNLNRGSETNIFGLQLSVLGNINHGKGTMVGLGAGLIANSSSGLVIGGQIAALNAAADMYGVQVGIWNNNPSKWTPAERSRAQPSARNLASSTMQAISTDFRLGLLTPQRLYTEFKSVCSTSTTPAH